MRRYMHLASHWRLSCPGLEEGSGLDLLNQCIVLAQAVAAGEGNLTRHAA